MLVRCITLSLDRFENQSDAKGEQEAMGWAWGCLVVIMVNLNLGFGNWGLDKEMPP